MIKFKIDGTKLGQEVDLAYYNYCINYGYISKNERYNQNKIKSNTISVAKAQGFVSIKILDRLKKAGVTNSFIVE